MARGFAKGLYKAPPEATSAVSDTLPEKSFEKEEFLLLAVLFILLAASPSLGVDSKYFFIITMAIIGLGGFKKAFGYLLY